jgi:selenocysteine lyase/cysteine desulfurase
MRIQRKPATVAAAVLAAALAASGRAEERRVQAEEMELTNYQIERGQAATYIKLTAPTGVAKFRFDLPSGRYDLDARYLSEKIGQNTYAVYLNDQQIIS